MNLMSKEADNNNPAQMAESFHVLMKRTGIYFLSFILTLVLLSFIIAKLGIVLPFLPCLFLVVMVFLCTVIFAVAFIINAIKLVEGNTEYSPIIIALLILIISAYLIAAVWTWNNFEFRWGA